MSGKPRRGLDQLRTHGSRRAGRRARHETYMRFTTLEMERSRRLAELRSTRRRLEALEERIGEIERECQALQKDLEPVQAKNQPPVDRFVFEY